MEFPGAVDSTMMNSFRSCPKQFWYSYIRRLCPVEKNPHFNAGGAFAKALEVARKTYWDIMDTNGMEKYALGESTRCGLVALWKAYGEYEPPAKYAHKSWERVSTAYVSYLTNWPLNSDHLEIGMFGGKRLIEFDFAIDLPIQHPVTKMPILYAGRIDWMGKYNNQLFCVDEKTCQYFTERWASNWTLRAQFPGYVWAAQQYGIPVSGMIVRGTAIKKTEIEHAEAIMPLAQWRVDRWYEQTLRDVKRMVQSWEDGYWDMNLGSSCVHFSGCEFFELCKARDDEPWMKPEAGMFRPNTWNPLEKEDD